MPRVPALALALVLTSCGQVQKIALSDAPTGDDASTIDASSIDAAPCTAYNNAFVTNEISFDSDIAPTAHADFETRADGTTGVTAGTPVPPNEYVACCGVKIEFVGTDPTGAVIWAGNAQGGFSVRASCSQGICNGTAGLRFTFTPPVAAVGAEYAGGTSMAVLDAQGIQLATMAVQGSGTNFLGYESRPRIGTVQFTDTGGEDVGKLLYHRCQ